MTNSESSFRRSELIFILALFIPVYIFTLSSNLAASHDSIEYIYKIENNKDLFHPHHLLYFATAKLWLNLFTSIGFRGENDHIVASLNSIAGISVLCLMYLILRKRFKLSRSISSLAILPPAFSFGFWFYSDCVEVYIIPLLFLALSLYLLSSNRLTTKMFVLIGVTHGLAVLFHQVHILFFPVVLTAIIFYRSESRKSITKSLLTYSSAFIPVVGLPYIIVMFGVLRFDSIGKAWYWLTLYAHGTGYFIPPSAQSLIKAVIGFSRSIIGGHFIFRIEWFNSFVQKLLPDKWLMDENFLVRLLDERFAYVFVVLNIALTIFIFYLLIIHRRNWRLLFSAHKRLISLLILWLLIYSCFFFLWDPSNLEFWIPQSICFWLLFIGLITQVRDKENHRTKRIYFQLGIISLFLITINYFGSIHWLREEGNDLYFLKVQPLKELSRANDLIIIGHEWIMEDYARRVTQANVLSLTTELTNAKRTDIFLRRIQDQISRTLHTHNKIYVMDDAVELERETIRASGEGITSIQQVWDVYKSRWKELSFTDSKIYVIE